MLNVAQSDGTMITPEAMVPSSFDRTLASANTAIDVSAEGILALRRALNESELGGRFVEAIRLLKTISGRLIVTGVGKSGHIGRKLAATFASTGTPAYFVHPTEASHGDLGMIDAQDAILALSWSGETAELASIINYAHRFNVPLIAVTASPGSTLAKAATIALVLPRIREACPHNLAPTTSTVLQLVIGDTLAVSLLAEKGFKPSDFHLLHPGGRLGAQLTYVRDFMHRGEHLPLAPLGTLMSDGIIRMTAVGFGVLGIVDAAGDLVGIITDGDLRRHMSEHLMSAPVERVMTRDPVTIGPDEIGARALEVLHAHRIGALFVVDGRTPVGILRFHDLLRIGLL